MRIATWNLNRPSPHGWKIRPRIEQQINGNPADIWVLTETHESIRPKNAVDFAQSQQSAGRFRQGERKTIIWSKWPIKRCLNTHDARRSVCIEIETKRGLWLVYGTVIPHLKSGEGVHDESTRNHISEWARLRLDYPKHRFVIAGDFNQSLDDAHGRNHYGTTESRIRLQQGLRDAQLHCVTSHLVTDLGSANIDHICVDAATESRIVRPPGHWSGISDDQVNMSDHIGVFVDLFESGTED